MKNFEIYQRICIIPKCDECMTNFEEVSFGNMEEVDIWFFENSGENLCLTCHMKKYPEQYT